MCTRPSLDLRSETRHWISTINFWDSPGELDKTKSLRGCLFSFVFTDLLTGEKSNTKVAPSPPNIKSTNAKNNIFRAKNIFEDTYQELHSQHKHCYLAVAPNQTGFCYFFPDWP